MERLMMTVLVKPENTGLASAPRTTYEVVFPLVREKLRNNSILDY